MLAAGVRPIIDTPLFAFTTRAAFATSSTTAPVATISAIATRAAVFAAFVAVAFAG